MLESPSKIAAELSAFKYASFPAVRIQFDAAGQIGRSVIVFDQIIQADREGFVDGVAVHVGAANGDGVSRQGIGIEQRSISHANLARVGVDLKRPSHALGLNGVGQRLGGVEHFVRIPFDQISQIYVIVIPATLSPRPDRQIVLTCIKIIWLAGTEMGESRIDGVSGYFTLPELLRICARFAPTPFALNSRVGSA